MHLLSLSEILLKYACSPCITPSDNKNKQTLNFELYPKPTDLIENDNAGYLRKVFNL